MGKHPRLLVILMISGGASDISGKCVRYLVYDPWHQTPPEDKSVLAPMCAGEDARTRTSGAHSSMGEDPEAGTSLETSQKVVGCVD
ncbi:hypothetical protein E5288_WYG004498 [Bos mutus]|uniref:Secreted protein n=1 Tax=Bos mutus TaxID=72004 RepID=A0A6B0RX21_9CETA|nr:hypothetical protein [Bos mutus]